MVILTCPKCGGDLMYSVICTYPPIHVVECLDCGYKDEKREGVTRVVYDEKSGKLKNVSETENRTANTTDNS